MYVCMFTYLPPGVFFPRQAFTAPVPGISGTDLNAAFLDGSDDGHWRIVSDAHEFTGAVAGANMYRSESRQNLTSWAPEGNGSLHRYGIYPTGV